MTNVTLQRLEKLSQAIGVTGYQGPGNIVDAISAELSSLVDQVERDGMGSVIGVKVGSQTGEPARKIMLAAHLDEIGAMVTGVDQGFLRFAEVGGLDDRLLMGQEVLVHGRRNLPGVIGSVPPHFLAHTKARDEVDPQAMVIDVGLPPEEVESLVRVGDTISFVRPVTQLLNGLVSGKAMDNRASVVAMMAVLEQLRQLRHEWDVYAVATANEEHGSFVGATTQAYKIQPDVAIALDVTFADVDEVDVKLGDGPVISFGPGNHPVIRTRLIELCEELELKFQSEIM
jgi:putative aminopeptidase FrvX